MASKRWLKLSWLMGLLSGINPALAYNQETIEIAIPKGSTVSDLLWEMVQKNPEQKLFVYGRKGLLKKTLKLNPWIVDPKKIRPGTKIILPFAPSLLELATTDQPAPPNKPTPVDQQPEIIGPPAPLSKKIWVATGLEIHNYNDSVYQASQTALPIAVGTNLPLDSISRWYLNAQTQGSLLKITNIHADTTVRYYEATGTAQYHWDHSPSLKLNAGAGIIYRTMSVSAPPSGTTYGYRGIGGGALAFGATWQKKYEFTLQLALVRPEVGSIGLDSREYLISAHQELSERFFLTQTYKHLKTSFVSTGTMTDQSLNVLIGAWVF